MSYFCPKTEDIFNYLGWIIIKMTLIEWEKISSKVLLWKL